MLKQNKVLITGGTGFIGTNLTAQLARDGYDIHVLTRSSSLTNCSKSENVTYHDLNSSEVNLLVRAISPDIIFHLAFARSKQSLREIVDCNIFYGSQILESLLDKKPVSIINIGTYWQHFDNKDYSPVDLYAASKEAFEKMAEYFIQTKNIKMLTLELFLTYGSDDKRRNIINQLLFAMKNESPLDVSLGEQLLDFLHIDDVVLGTQSALHHLNSLTLHTHTKYCLASGNFMTLRKFVEEIESLSQRKIDVRFGAIPYPKRQIMQPEINVPVLPNWKPKISLKEGLTQVIHDYQRST